MQYLRRKQIRTPDFDYSQPGVYFITICTYQRQLLFGKVESEQMWLSPIGIIAEEEWKRTSIVRPNIELGAFVVMPNHLHGLIVITSFASVGATRRVAPTLHSSGPKPGSIGAIIGQFKSIVTKRVKRELTSYGDVWQRNYYEHVVRSENEHDHFHKYIESNLINWQSDDLFQK